MKTFRESPENKCAEEFAAETCVSAHNTSPDRTVFTESGNTDGWIATSLTVSLKQ